MATEKSNMIPEKEQTNAGWSCQSCKNTRSSDTEKFSCEACAKEICEACCKECDEDFCTIFNTHEMEATFCSACINEEPWDAEARCLKNPTCDACCDAQEWSYSVDC